MNQSKSLSEEYWVAIWERAGKELEIIRCRETKCADTRISILSLGDAFEWAVLHQPLPFSSGIAKCTSGP
jgi:hypothetical protein